MVGFEIFNVFDVQNAITMTWVRDVSKQVTIWYPKLYDPKSI
ncbi:MAG: hypothetical protein CM15mP83_9560 [Flavobacteriaceae bacterium]|nr:MAG: hypothetical protein CM15mP83_9560 [Flavobacteriaceae bacterium]